MKAMTSSSIIYNSNQKEGVTFRQNFDLVGAKSFDYLEVYPHYI